MSVKCPSGLRGEVREWNVADEDVLVQALDQDGLAGNSLSGLETLICDSWIKTTDPGPYGSMDKLDLDRVLSVDLLYVLVAARMKTWGPQVLCDPPCPGGNHLAEGLANLSQCKAKRIVPAVAEALRTGSTIPVDLPRSKRRVGVRLMTRPVEREIGAIAVQYPKDRVTRMFMARAPEVEGFDPETGCDVETKLPLFDWYKQLPGQDSMVLKGKIIEIDPSYDTEATVRCSTCRAMAVAEITVQADFFVPTGRAQSLSANSSS